MYMKFVNKSLILTLIDINLMENYYFRYLFFKYRFNGKNCDKEKNRSRFFILFYAHLVCDENNNKLTRLSSFLFNN